MQFLTTGHRPPTTGNRHLRLDGRAVPTPFRLAANAQPCRRQHPYAAPAARITTHDSRLTTHDSRPFRPSLVRGDSPRNAPLCMPACLRLPRRPVSKREATPPCLRPSRSPPTRSRANTSILTQLPQFESRFTTHDSRLTAVPALPCAGGLPPQRSPSGCQRACASRVGLSATGRQCHRDSDILTCRQSRRARRRRECESLANRASTRPSTASAVSGHRILTTGLRPLVTGHRPPTTGHRQLQSRNPVPPSPARVSETCYTARLSPNAPHHTSARPPCPGRRPCRPTLNRTSELWPLRTSPKALSIRICNAPTRHPPRPPSTVESRPPYRPCPCRRHPARNPVTRSTQLPLFCALSAPERHHLRTSCPKPTGI